VRLAGVLRNCGKEGAQSRLGERPQDAFAAMSQTRLGSFAEALANIAIGFAINFAANWLLLPLFGFRTLTLWANFELGLLYTMISLVRSFILRRYFNGLRFGNK
jgi:hypothetical protein